MSMKPIITMVKSRKFHVFWNEKYVYLVTPLFQALSLSQQKKIFHLQISFVMLPQPLGNDCRKALHGEDHHENNLIKIKIKIIIKNLKFAEFSILSWRRNLSPQFPQATCLYRHCRCLGRECSCLCSGWHDSKFEDFYARGVPVLYINIYHEVTCRHLGIAKMVRKMRGTMTW